MKRPTEIVLWVAATVVLSGLTAWLVGGGNRDAVKEASEQDLHHWMHERLVLSESQHEVLEPIESAYEESRRALSEEISAAGRELAQAVSMGNQESPEVDQALVRLSAAQAELRRSTLDHFFAMKEHLDPEQAKKLLEWTHESIVHE